MKISRLKTPFPRSYWVIPGILLAGEFPGSENQEDAKNKILSLIGCGIRAVINLMEPDETDHSGRSFKDYEPITTQIGRERSTPITCISFPISDQNVPTAATMRKILDAIITSIDDHKPVYIHCWGGIGRTGTVVGCFLMKNGLAHRSNVLKTIADLRQNDPKSHRISPETDAQREFVQTWNENDQNLRTGFSRTLGCLLGGAVGDALGAPVEFMKRDDILGRFGPEGITVYAPAYGGLGSITDDTQMTLFTAEGLLRGNVRGRHKGIASYAGMVAHAYLRWLYTQGEPHAPGIHAETHGEGAGWLILQKELHYRRAPGNTCISALKAMSAPNTPARNTSKGCGGVMRVAPVGLFHWRLKDYHSPQETFQLGAEAAALTHGHPTGVLPAGVLSVLIRELADGAGLTQALASVKVLLRRAREHDETLRAIELAEELSRSGLPHAHAIARIGQGWIAEEALAIAVYCALVANNFRDGVILAVNHDGDSDSTGAIAGNLLGAMFGAQAIPQAWLDSLELRDVITELAEDLYFFPCWDIGEYSQNDELNQFVWLKYPGF